MLKIWIVNNQQQSTWRRGSWYTMPYLAASNAQNKISFSLKL